MLQTCTTLFLFYTNKDQVCRPPVDPIETFLFLWYSATFLIEIFVLNAADIPHCGLVLHALFWKALH